MSSRPTGTRKPARGSAAPRPAGFTLLELLVVLTIIGLLASIAFSAFYRARLAAWKQKTRNTGRQLAMAWNQRLQDDGQWPPASAFENPVSANNDLTFNTTAANMALVSVASNNAQSRIYFELNAEQRVYGLKDHWNNFFHVRLDTDYNGTVTSPTNTSSVIHANVIVWSDGPDPTRDKEKVVIW